MRFYTFVFSFFISLSFCSSSFADTMIPITLRDYQSFKAPGNAYFCTLISADQNQVKCKVTSVIVGNLQVGSEHVINFAPPEPDPGTFRSTRFNYSMAPRFSPAEIGQPVLIYEDKAPGSKYSSIYGGKDIGLFRSSQVDGERVFYNKFNNMNLFKPGEYNSANTKNNLIQFMVKTKTSGLNQELLEKTLKPPTP